MSGRLQLHNVPHTPAKMHALPSEWRLVEAAGRALPLPRAMLFLGRDDCDINIPSRSVDKRHAVFTYDGYEDKFRVKDLSSVNGTYVNDERLAEQEYVTLEDMDTIRFGFDPVVYRMERIEELPHLEQQEEMVKAKPSYAKFNESPPGSPARSPPPLVTSSAELPTWAVRDPSPRPWEAAGVALAECQGCIEEQGIRHTCGDSEDGSNHHHHHHHVLHTQSERDNSCMNGYKDIQESANHTSFHNRWKDSRSKLFNQEQVYSDEDKPFYQQAGYTSNSVDCTDSVCKQGNKYRTSAHVHFDGVSVSRPTLCRTDVTIPPSREALYSFTTNHTDRRNSDGWSSEYQNSETKNCVQRGNDINGIGRRNSESRSSGRWLAADGRPPISRGQTIVLDELKGVVQPMIDEWELAESQEVNRDGTGNLSPSCENLPQPFDHEATQKPPSTQTQENYHTHFQIIPPRQGQNYRVINVQFTAPNLNKQSPPSESDSRPDSSASSGYHSLKTSLGHFVFMSPPMDESAPPAVSPEESSPTLMHSTVIRSDKPNLIRLNTNQADKPTRLNYSPDKPTFSHHSPKRVNNGSSPHHIHDPYRPVHDYQHPVEYHADQARVIRADYAEMGTSDVSFGSECSDDSNTSTVTQTTNSSCAHTSQSYTIMKSGILSPTSSIRSPTKSGRCHRRSLTGTDPELETLQKCTPLYGQPAWWGDEEHEPSECEGPSTAVVPDGAVSIVDKNEKAAVGTERPSSLALSSANRKQEAIDMNKYKTDPRYATTYMEIPQRDVSPSVSPGSKSPGPKSPGPSTPRTSPAKGTTDKAAGPMAFTVDLGDEMGEPLKLQMKKSLSEFLPHKVRKSFRSRSVKSRNKTGDDKEDSPPSGNSSKASRDGSPMSRMSRADQMNNRYHSDGGHNSALSSDNEDLSIRSDTVTTKTSRHRSSGSGAASRRPHRDKSAGRTSGVARADLRKQQTSATSTGDTTNYLIERMFNQSPGRHEPELSSMPDLKVSPPQENVSRPAVAQRPGVLLTARQRQTSLCEPTDNVSESGTYTIEAETQGSDLKQARQSIDAVFGVTDLEHEDINDVPITTNGSTATLDKAALLRAAGSKSRHDAINVMSTDHAKPSNISNLCGRSDITTGGHPVEEDPEPESVLDKEDTPVWVSQWATLATQKTFVKTPTLTTQTVPTLVGYGENADVQSSSESGISVRKPRGTGRRLPAVPIAKSSSTTPQSPHSTTAASSEMCSTRESTFSEVVSSEPTEREVDSRTKPTAYIDPRPPEVVHDDNNDVDDDVHEMLKNSGVTSDVVTFVYDEMADSMQTQMSTSVTSSRMTESMLDEELTHQPGDMNTTATDQTNHQQEFTQQISRQEDEEELRDLAKHFSQHSVSSVRSGASINTDVLLKDTAEVVRAMADRVKANTEQQQNKTNDLWNRKSTELFIPLHDDDSDSEGSSRCLNGRGEMPKFKPKPKLFKSHSTDPKKTPTKPFLSREQREKESTPDGKQYKDKSRTTALPRTSPKLKSSSVKPRTTQSHPAQPTTPKIPKDATFVKPHRPLTVGRHKKHNTKSLDLNSSFGSDLHSESETGSIVSTSTDYSESLSPKLGRRGSAGKGPMTMTRPNRAFALRRARLEGEPEPPPTRSQTNTPKPHPTMSRSQSNTPKLRPNSAGPRDASRSRPSSARDIVRSERSDPKPRSKTPSRESSVGPPRAKSAGARTDTGRFTARQIEKKPSSTSIARKLSGPSSSTKNRSERNSISNPVLSGTRSKPTSRSNSPQTHSKARSEEYSAWKRRKTYDPRQAVVNAKAKAKEQKSKPLPERSLSAGPHMRNSTFSSVSSEDTSYMDELAAYGCDRDAITHVSSTVSHQMDAMSRSIESDDAFIDNKLTSSGRELLPWAGRSSRSAFRTPRSSNSVPLTQLRAPPPPSPRRQSSGRSNSLSLSNDLIAKQSTPAQNSTAPPPHRPESYDSVMVSSIYQLSRKVRTQTNKLMEKMRKEDHNVNTPSPIDDGRTAFVETDLPGYKNANQELIGILRNLRSTERHLQIIDRSLFPMKAGAAVSPATSPHNHEQYLRELERIRTEISGFKPIDDPPSIVSSSSRSSWRRTSHESDGTDIDAGDPLASDEYY